MKSINTSGHRFGLVHPGIGWLIFRDEEQLPEDLVFYEDYLGERDATFTLNFSCSASFVLARYYMLLREGREGHTSLVRAMAANRDALAGWLSAIDASRCSRAIARCCRWSWPGSTAQRASPAPISSAISAAAMAG